jgi:membrane protein required for colicin V production
MNVLDIIILCFVALLLVNGIRKGFIISLASLIALVLGIYAAVFFSNYIRDLLVAHVHPSATWLPVLSFVITFLIVVIVIMLIAKALEKLVDLVGMGFLNKLAGAVFGVLKAILLLSIIFFIIHTVDKEDKLIKPKYQNESIFYKPISMIFPFMLKIVGKDIRFPG